jgi:hypothetical protein
MAWLEVMVTFGEANYNFLPCCLKITLKRSTDPSYNGEFTVKLLDEKRRLLVSIDQQQKMKAVAIDDADTFIVEGGNTKSIGIHEHSSLPHVFGGGLGFWTKLKMIWQDRIIDVDLRCNKYCHLLEKRKI